MPFGMGSEAGTVLKGSHFRGLVLFDMMELFGGEAFS
jgi:hypothetical protein